MATAPSAFMMSLALVLAMTQSIITVGPDADYQSVADAIAGSVVHDTIVVQPGVYQEHIRVDWPLTVVGEPGAIIDGGGVGRVIQVFAPATISGLMIRGSGRDLSQEDAGIWVTKSDDVRIADNILEDVLFGIYIKESRRPVVANNDVTGKPLAPGRRGDGVRLWYSANGRIADNDIRQVRDVVVWFSDSTLVERNTVVDSRYGLHYMYSNFNRFVDNRFERNEVGAFLMYSRDIVFERNTFAYALGPFGKGLGFKDTEHVRASSNLIVKNSIGIFLDNSPLSRDVVNVFRDNVVAFNEVGITMLPSVKSNQFVQNAFLGNIQVVNVTGGGSGTGNSFRENFWSEYAGFDEDNDGRGDTPYTSDHVTDDVLSDNEQLQLFRLSTAAFALDALGRLMPVLKPTPLLVDSAPLMQPPILSWAPSTAQGGTPLASGLGVIGVAVVGFALIIRGRRRHHGHR